MATFALGDHVRIRSDLGQLMIYNPIRGDNGESNSVVPDMVRFAGDIATVRSIDCTGGYSFIGMPWRWTDGMLEKFVFDYEDFTHERVCYHVRNREEYESFWRQASAAGITWGGGEPWENQYARTPCLLCGYIEGVCRYDRSTIRLDPTCERYNGRIVIRAVSTTPLKPIRRTKSVYDIPDNDLKEGEEVLVTQ